VALAGCAGRSDVSTGDANVPAVPAIVSVGELTSVTLRPGESTNVAISVVVAPGYHIQSNPASNEFLIPLELQMDDTDDVRFGTPDYPAHESYRLAGTEEDLMTYDGTVTIAVPVTLSSSALSGERYVKGNLRYQACDSRRCLFPASVPVAFKIVVR
jgi:hypothetical protein